MVSLRSLITHRMFQMVSMLGCVCVCVCVCLSVCVCVCVCLSVYWQYPQKKGYLFAPRYCLDLAQMTHLLQNGYSKFCKTCNVLKWWFAFPPPPPWHVIFTMSLLCHVILHWKETALAYTLHAFPIPAPLCFLPGWGCLPDQDKVRERNWRRVLPNHVWPRGSLLGGSVCPSVMTSSWRHDVSPVISKANSVPARWVCHTLANGYFWCWNRPCQQVEWCWDQVFLQMWGNHPSSIDLILRNPSSGRQHADGEECWALSLVASLTKCTVLEEINQQKNGRCSLVPAQCTQQHRDHNSIASCQMGLTQCLVKVTQPITKPP